MKFFLLFSGQSNIKKNDDNSGCSPAVVIPDTLGNSVVIAFKELRQRL